jgi:hypothetical protein
VEAGSSWREDFLKRSSSGYLASMWWFGYELGKTSYRATHTFTIVEG